MQEDEDDTSENGRTDTSEDEEDKTTLSDESQEEPDELDSDQIKRIGMFVAPAFDYNPRLVKTFVNLFRLRTMLATELKLFRASEGSEDRARLTPEQLGKFVAISIRWPALLPHLDQKTLEILHDAALRAPQKGVF
jgi:hypothetical protein